MAGLFGRPHLFLALVHLAFYSSLSHYHKTCLASIRRSSETTRLRPAQSVSAAINVLQAPFGCLNTAMDPPHSTQKCAHLGKIEVTPGTVRNW